MASQRGNRQATRSGGAGAPGWALILLGIVLGAGLMAFVVHRGLIPSLRRGEQPQANPNAVAAPGSPAGIAANGASDAAPKFDFYKVLPEKEVVIPNAELAAMARAEQGKAATTTGASNALDNLPGATPGGYVLQVGSFPSAAAAEAMKAKLALQGFTAHLQTVKLDGQAWNRVSLGPYASATQLQAVQTQLAAAGIKSIPLKER